nr:M14 family zinc carboxypeptidase [uncultured Psychroserpens sp.]
MKKITYLVLLFMIVIQNSFAQDTYKRIIINSDSQSTINTLLSNGIDLRCGAIFKNNSIQLELSEDQIAIIDNAGLGYTVTIDDLTAYHNEQNEIGYVPSDNVYQNTSDNSSVNINGRSISSTIIDNYLQYYECEEKPWSKPVNYKQGSLGGCLTVDQMEVELDSMHSKYPSLISAKANASPTNQTTWGNPSSIITNNGLTYTGQGTTRWAPKTMWYVRITGDQSSPEGSKPQILYTSMIHSREVSSLMSNMYFMWYLLENYNTDLAIKNLVDNNELYFIPVVNPDGLRWNQHLNSNGGTFQRKNCRPNTGNTTNTTATRGVDINRNFDYLWGADGDSSGSSDIPNSDTYRGPFPFSEPESQILRDFVLARNFETCLMHHSAANAIPHPYGGVPTRVSNREDEMHQWHEDMTMYNRYVSGATIFTPANGIADDWMLGGTPDSGNTTSNSNNSFPNHSSGPSIGSGKNILASTPEHGSYNNEGGFWPALSQIDGIAARGMRLNLMNAYYGGKYAKFHDLTQSDISSLTSNLTFGIERISQTPSDYTLTVTPVSSNIVSIATIPTQTGMNVLDQNNVSTQLVLDGSIQPNDKIEYNVQLSDGTNVFYNVNFEKYYQPDVLLTDNPDTNAITTNWNLVGTWTNSNASGASYSGSRAIKIGGNTVTSYGNNQTQSLTTKTGYDLSNSQEVLVQFYTKWDLERNFDFVEFEGSVDGTTWVSLCGNYNKPKASNVTTNEHGNKSSTSHSFQQNNSNGRVYDGDRMDKWVMEEVVINSSFNSFLFESPNAQFRFRFRSDANNRFENYSANAEGFFIDDFKIISVQAPCDNSVAPTGLSVNTVTTSSAEVTWDNIPSATYDLRYRENGSGPTGWTTITGITTNNYSITGLLETTDYQVRVRTRCGTSTSDYGPFLNFTTATPIPCTGTSISTFPYSESFENTFGLWTNATTDDFNWTNKQEETDGNSTPSANTGPSLASDGDYFLFIEASNPNFPTKVARLVSPCLDFTGRENASLSFDYHMFGAFTGVLTVDISIDNGATYFTLTDYTLTGAQHNSHVDPWKTQNVDLSLYDGQSIKLRFSATTNADTTTGWQGDISIDNFLITSDVAGSAPPVAQCQNINVQLDASGNATIVATDVDGGSTDDIAITNYAIDIDTFNCSNIGTPVDVTLTVTDGDNQTDTCIATVTVVDQIAPEFVNVPTNMTLTCGSNNPTWVDPTVTDNCATGLTLTRTDTTGLNSGDIFPVGTTIISYAVNDGNGNSNTTSFTVDILDDTENPIASCQNITVQLDGTGNATITASQINNDSTDNCAIASITASQTTFTCANEGANNVTLTVTDTNGNQATCVAVVTVELQNEPTISNCWEATNYNYSTCSWEITGTQPEEPTSVNCWDDYQFNDTTCAWENQGTEPIEPTAVNCWDDYQFNDTTCAWENQGTEPVEPTGLECWEMTSFNNTTCAWEVSGSQPEEPTAVNCWDDYQFNDTTCTWENQGTEPVEPTGLECWEMTSFNNTTCAWEVSGTQPEEPTAVNCWDDYQFNDTTCAWENQGTEPVEPTGLDCWETTSFNDTTCAWEVSGTQPEEPTAVNCWDDYQFNDTTCAWENQGTEPIEPTAVNCWDDYQFNDTICAWENQGTEPVEPTGLECWEMTSFNNTTCTWEVSGSQPEEPTAVNCWDDYQFNDTTCTWENQGTEPVEPTGLECWEMTSFNNTTCAWEVSGTQPEEPTAVNCWDDYQFNDTTCAWENQGTEPVEPTGLDCWETTSFNDTTCAWEVSGTQPEEPTAVNCWDDYQFNDTTCAWENQGTEPIEPTAVNCWDDYQFNDTICAWENQGTEPVEPTGLECWEMTSFNNTTCTWEVSGSQPEEPTAVNCWDDYQFNNTTCAWENQGTEPVEPTGLECWETTSFNNTTCAWEVSGSQPEEPTAVNCWDDYQFNDTTCAWENQGTEPVEPTGLECWETTSFNNTTCAWEVSGSQPEEPTAVNCWDDYQFNNATCTWENQGTTPSAPTQLNAISISDTAATITWSDLTPLEYDLRYREVGNSTWLDIIDITTNSQALTGLTPFTQYEVEVRSKCSVTGTSEYSTTLTFATLMSNPDTYCGSQSSDASEEYISRVQLADIDNVSGAQNYSDFTDVSTVLRKGTAHTITITPTWPGTVYNEAYSVWIDYNKDGDFEDAGEQVVTIAPTNTATVDGSFTVPVTALDTKTRMRVSMKWNDIPDPCEAFQYGEVEDYTVIIVGLNDLIYTNSAWTPYAPSALTITDNAFVLDGTYTVTDDIQINNMSVCDGAGIVVEKAKAMTVNGILKTADNLVLESDSNEYSSLFVENFVVGTAQYKRHVNATASIGGNDLIAPPVYGESFIDFRAENTNILSNSANTLFLFGPFDKISDTYLLYTNTETAPLRAGIGYRAASTDASTFTFTGQVKIGDLSVPVVNDGPTNPEWNLIGNPYPAYLDLNSFLAANSAQFELSRAGIYGYDGYASDGWTIWNQAYADANPNALITPGQGFLIASATNNGQIEFTASMRRTGNADDFILGRNANSTSINHLQLKLESNQGGAYKTDFYFTDNASNGMDFNYDAAIYGNAAPSNFALYSHLLEEHSGNDMAIQSLGFDALSNAVIPLGLHSSAGHQLTVSISESDIPETVQVYLEDTVNNTFTLLNNSDYTITLNENLNDIGRYFLRFEQETLSVNSNNFNELSIYTTTQPEALFVKGQLFEDTQLSIYDLQGRLIKSMILSASKTSHRIDVTSFNTGVYMVSLKNKTQEKIEKVIIK